MEQLSAAKGGEISPASGNAAGTRWCQRHAAGFHREAALQTPQDVSGPIGVEEGKTTRRALKGFQPVPVGPPTGQACVTKVMKTCHMAASDTAGAEHGRNNYTVKEVDINNSKVT